MSAAAVPPPELRPMLATPGVLPAVPGDWAYEVKWDGMRMLVRLPGDGTVGLRSRHGRDVTAQYPELAVLPEALPAGTAALLDAEAVLLGADGRPSFGRLQERMSLYREAAVRAAARTAPVTVLFFDVLWLRGRDTTALPYTARRELLAGLGIGHPRAAVPANWVGTGRLAFDWTRSAGLEGVIAKRLDSRYRPGVRSRDWIKVKHLRTADVVVGGWVPDGPRATACQALLIGTPDPTGLRYAGRVGTGFTERDRRTLAALLRPLRQQAPPFTANLAALREEAGREVHWVRPVTDGEVEYLEQTSGGRLRQPVWRGLRGDAAEEAPY
ncbi:non-homologous end-joining DNA ligase [Streptomyces sp. NPDC092296]|uniref:non-homologous end-joining DNA ligase n=1 Tax=Streptomyces sp. NPDC092296 TaxID=3366012 RepID=UPI003800942D